MQQIKQVSIITKTKLESSYIVGEAGVCRIVEMFYYNGGTPIFPKHHFIEVLDGFDNIIAKFDALCVPCVIEYYRVDLTERQRECAEAEYVLEGLLSGRVK